MPNDSMDQTLTGPNTGLTLRGRLVAKTPLLTNVQAHITLPEPRKTTGAVQLPCGTTYKFYSTAVVVPQQPAEKL